MSNEKSTLQKLEEKFEKARNNPDKRDAAEKSQIGELALDSESSNKHKQIHRDYADPAETLLRGKRRN